MAPSNCARQLRSTSSQYGKSSSHPPNLSKVWRLRGSYVLSGGKLIFKSKTAKLTLGGHAGAVGALTLSQSATAAIVTMLDGAGGLGQVTIGKGGVVKVAKRISIGGKSMLEFFDRRRNHRLGIDRQGRRHRRRRGRRLDRSGHR